MCARCVHAAVAPAWRDATAQLHCASLHAPGPVRQACQGPCLHMASLPRRGPWSVGVPGAGAGKRDQRCTEGKSWARGQRAVPDCRARRDGGEGSQPWLGEPRTQQLEEVGMFCAGSRGDRLALESMGAEPHSSAGHTVPFELGPCGQVNTPPCASRHAGPDAHYIPSAHARALAPRSSRHASGTA